MIRSIIHTLNQQKKNIIITPEQGSHKAYLAARSFKALGRTMVAALPDSKTALAFMEDLKFFMPDKLHRLLYFPGYHIQAFKSLSYNRDTSTTRLGVLSRLVNDDSPVFVVTHIETLVQKLIPKQQILSFSELVMANEEIDREDLVSKLEAGGYIRTSLVEDPGDYSVRGGILDLFPPGDQGPVRLEFFGDLVESIRYFSPYTQRGTKEIFETIVGPATEAVLPEPEIPKILARLRMAGAVAGLDAAVIRDYVNTIREMGRFPGIESMLSIVYERLDSFFDYLPEDSLFFLDGPDRLQNRVVDFQNKALLNYKTVTHEKRLGVKPETIYLSWDQTMERIDQHTWARFQPLGFEEDRQKGGNMAYNCTYNQNLFEELRTHTGEDTPLTPLVNWLETHQAKKDKTLCVVSQPAQARRLASLLAPYGIAPRPVSEFNRFETSEPGIYCLIGNLGTGFVIEDQGLALITETEIFGKKRIPRRRTGHRSLKTELIAPEELKNGDIVVHMEHGLGRYEGLCSLKIQGIAQDFILILFQDDDKLYLPVDRIEMIGKYVGMDGYEPILDKIGSKAWARSKAKAKAEVEKMAADLLDLYAKRRTNTGFSFSRPDNFYNDFEASFPYEETRDQLKAIDDVNLDMESSTPMDRLVCGDVGYGKTEVAIRASFKAVNDGKQAAVVVPTTILAEQHLLTFRERFKQYPVTVECLSRFRTRKEQTRILKQIRAGSVDIVIGTHRLLQKDVDFKSLGLLVIDEEQRFGVKHKEALKKKRSMVDVLALSATPIPRTLHMSLTGMRDISVIATPPASRQPIVSYISKYEDGIARDAIQKELARKGQVFFVHNNIKTIEKQAGQLQSLVPDAKIGVAHGRLSEAELEKVMFQFVNFEINLLVCTTIVESGLDIPSANTMIINRAELFGLSQIYQLRGRIGRGDHQAYAYLFVSDQDRLTKDAKKRLSALMEHRDLGSGFQIAMKDLKIRGAGTALGASQSGHIAAVGYDMFLKLLDNAVHDLKGEARVEPLEPEINAAMSSGFPELYIESVEQRLTLYRRLSRITEVSEISDMKNELLDRYGKLPREAENMLLKIMLRVYAIQAGVKRLDITPNTLNLTFSSAHMGAAFETLEQALVSSPPHKFLKRESIQFQLGHGKNKISPALVETKNILRSIISHWGKFKKT